MEADLSLNSQRQIIEVENVINLKPVEKVDVSRALEIELVGDRNVRQRRQDVRQAVQLQLGVLQLKRKCLLQRFKRRSFKIGKTFSEFLLLSFRHFLTGSLQNFRHKSIFLVRCGIFVKINLSMKYYQIFLQ